MRLVSWRRRDAIVPSGPSWSPPRLGLLVDADSDGAGGRVLPLEELPGLADEPARARALAAGDTGALLEADPDLRATRAGLAGLGLERARQAALPQAGARLLAPLRPTRKIVCVGLNYRDHVEEQGIDMPERPTLFAKFDNAVVGNGEPIVHHEWTHALDLEAELGVVIGRRASRVSARDAMAYVAGYTVANDVSARDLQGQKVALRAGERGDGQWLRAKGSDTFLPLGPALVTADEVPDVSRLSVRSWRTTAVAGGPGETGGRPIQMQDGSTADMIFDVPRLIEFISAVITLEPGDLVITGTPAGVGVFRTPPVYLVPGDVATVEVAGIGRLDNPVVAADGSAPLGTPAAALLGERA